MTLTLPTMPTYVITELDLFDLDVCANQSEIFKQVFPNGAVLNQINCIIARREGLDAAGLAASILFAMKGHEDWHGSILTIKAMYMPLERAYSETRLPADIYDEVYAIMDHMVLLCVLTGTLSTELIEDLANVGSENGFQGL